MFYLSDACISLLYICYKWELLSHVMVVDKNLNDSGFKKSNNIHKRHIPKIMQGGL